LEDDLNPNFESLRADSRYQAIIDFLRNDMETQRQEYLSWQQAEGRSLAPKDS